MPRALPLVQTPVAARAASDPSPRLPRQASPAAASAASPCRRDGLSFALLDDQPRQGDAAARAFLVCRVRGAEYGLPVDQVSETRTGTGHPPLPADDPSWPERLRLGDEWRPVVDLHGLLDVAAGAQAAPRHGPEAAAIGTLVIIAPWVGRLALRVDSIEDIVPLDAAQILAAPAYAASLPPRALIGLGTAGDRQIRLLDLPPLLAAHERGVAGR